jgi:serine/threonine protein kinase
MSADYTQQQNPADLERSKDLSLQKTRPPMQVRGYEAQRFLGAGAYGEVWAGVDKNTGRSVAIKFYAHRRGVDWSLLNREVEKLVFLSADRYVVQLLEVGWDADPPYYVMEYVENGSLEDLLRREGSFAPAEAVEIFREIAVGLAHAHGKGVLHCDLKPANILLDQDNRPRLADFGQSRLSHEQKPALGTLFYMAPEQADLQAVPDVRWDVYALGAILHCLLTGHPPHKSEGTISQIDTAHDLPERLARYREVITHSPPSTEHRHLRGMDRALADIVDRCLAPQPSQRFSNVQEVLDALAARQRNRNRLPLLLLGFLGPLLLLVVTAIFSWRGYVQAIENTEANYQQLAIENNSFTAQLAAEKVRNEIRTTFDIARDEAAAPQLQALLIPVLEGDALQKLNDAGTPDALWETARTAFRDDSARHKLETYINDRLQAMHAAAARDHYMPMFASVFLTDDRGTQIVAAHDEDVPSQVIGKNFAHRTYFSGGDVEREPFKRPPDNPPHVTRSHLSNVFKSSTTKKWKVAISTPIYRQLDSERKVFAGLLVVTVNLGDFESFQSAGQQRNRFAVLVDGRHGADTGTILQHPLFDEVLREKTPVQDDFRKYRVSPAMLTGQGGLYEDPLGKHPAGAAYAKRWIAAASPVRALNANSPRRDSGLIVLVQSNYDMVVQPARELGNYFFRNFMWMLVVVVAVSLGLWYLVVRLFREPRPAARSSSGAITSLTPVHGAETMAATARLKE